MFSNRTYPRFVHEHVLITRCFANQTRVTSNFARRCRPARNVTRAIMTSIIIYGQFLRPFACARHFGGPRAHVGKTYLISPLLSSAHDRRPSMCVAIIPATEPSQLLLRNISIFARVKVFKTFSYS